MAGGMDFNPPLSLNDPLPSLGTAAIWKHGIDPMPMTKSTGSGPSDGPDGDLRLFVTGAVLFWERLSSRMSLTPSRRADAVRRSRTNTAAAAGYPT